MGSRRNFIGSGTSAALESDIGEGHCTVGTGTVAMEPEARACRAMAKGEEKDPNSSVIVVDKHGSGNCRTIGQAISMAMPGTLINVMSGIYRGSLKIKKDGLTIIGIGDVTVVSSGFDTDTIHFNADAGTIKNIKIVSKGLVPTLCAVNVIRGKLLLEGCDLTCDEEAVFVVRARKDANPIIRGNRIHNSWYGVLIEGAGVIEENHVHDFGSCGIQLGLDSPAVVRKNRIWACCKGVILEGTSKGKLEGNHLFDNETGIDLTKVANPLIKGNHIYSNGCGIALNGEVMTAADKKGPRGVTITANEIHHNDQSGIEVSCWNAQYEVLNSVYKNRTEACKGTAAGA